MGKKKATVGERITLTRMNDKRDHFSVSCDTTLGDLRNRNARGLDVCRDLAKAIDRAIRKAAKDERRAIHAAIFNSFTAQGRPKEQRQAAATIMAMIRRRGV